MTAIFPIVAGRLMVRGFQRTGPVVGHAFFVSPRGLMISAAHVFDPPDAATGFAAAFEDAAGVPFTRGFQWRRRLPECDLIVARVAMDSTPYLDVQFRAVGVGERVRVGTGGSSLESEVISRGATWMEIDGAFDAAASGSPVFGSARARDEVVGVFSGLATARVEWLAHRAAFTDPVFGNLTLGELISSESMSTHGATHG